MTPSQPSAALVFVAAILASGPPAAAEKARPAPKPFVSVAFSAPERGTLFGDFHAPGKGAPVLLLLNGLDAGRGGWRDFALALSARGWGSLTIDPLGYGQSGRSLHPAAGIPGGAYGVEKDIAGALIFLAKEGIPAQRVVPVGAGDGAPIVLDYALREKDIPFVVLLSPGRDYQGLRLEGSAREFDRPMILAAAIDDPVALQSAEASFRSARDKARSVVLKAKAGHGATLLKGAAGAGFAAVLFGAMEKLARSGSPGAPDVPPR